MNTKHDIINGYVESTYQGGSIIMKYHLNEYHSNLAALNMVQEKYIPYMLGWV